MGSAAEGFGPEKCREILVQNGIGDEVEDILIESGSVDGVGYASLRQRVTVTFKNGIRSPLLLFVKSRCKNKDLAEHLDKCLVFEKECKFFGNLLPDLINFAQKQPNYDGFLENFTTKCYYAGTDLIVLEHLKPKGFVTPESHLPLPREPARLALVCLAKFHAATYAYMKAIGYDVFKKKYPFVLVTTWSEVGVPVNAIWFHLGVHGAIKILRERPTQGSERALEYFRQYESDAYLKLCNRHYDINKPSCGLTLNHGDFWSANMLFKFSPETNSPTDCLLIDWQTIHLGSPVLDLQHYLFYVVDKNLRRNELADLLTLYFESLEKYVKMLGQELTFTFNEMVRDFRSKCEPGFVFSTYNIFAMEALKQAGDIVNQAGDFDENLSTAMYVGLDQLMLEKGEEYSRELVAAFEEYEQVRLQPPELLAANASN